MALKDTWKDLQDAVQGVLDSGDDASVEPINDIAHAVIDLEDNINRKEDKNNKVNSIRGNFEDYTDEQYPTVNAVKMEIIESTIPIQQAVDTKEDASNKVTYISENSTDEQYPSAKAVYDKIWYVSELAEGANIAKAFDSYADLIAWVDNAPASGFFQSAVIPNYYMPIGNNIMIKTLDVPDLWVMKYAESSTPLCEDITADAQTAGMTLDEYIVHLLKTQGYFDTKWIRFTQLETQKVDLSEYYTKTEVNSAIQSAILDSWEVPV